MLTGAELLTIIMKAKGLTHLQAAVLLGLDRPFVTNLASGNRKPGRGSAIQIEDRWGISVRAWGDDEVTR